MLKVYKAYVTPATGALFLVSGVSGAALFFNLGPGLFHSMHAWLGMMLLVAVFLHLRRNWGALVSYAKGRRLMLPGLVSLAAAAAFLGASAGSKRPPSPAAQIISRLPISTVALALKTTPQELARRLESRGYRVRSNDQTFGDIAADRSVDTDRLLFELLPPKLSSNSSHDE